MLTSNQKSELDLKPKLNSQQSLIYTSEWPSWIIVVE